MKLPLLALAAGLAAQSAAAQTTTLGPWVEVNNAPGTSGLATSFDASLQLPTDGSLWSLRTGNSGHGLRGAVLIATSTNGSTWRKLSFNAQTVYTGLGPANGRLPTSFFAVDSLRAWAVVTTYSFPGFTELWRTTTGPAGLAVAPSQPPLVEGSSVYFFDANTGFVVNNSSQSVPSLYRTANAGQSWQQVANLPTTAGSTLLGGTLLGTTAWLAFDNGSLLRSTDAGLTWTALTPPVPLAVPSFRDAQHGLALGYIAPSSSAYYSTLYRTVDGGTTWAPVTLAGPVRWGQLAAVPGTAGTFLAVGIAAASYGGFSTFISSNDGLTWQGLGSTRSLRNVAANRPDNIWATTENGPGPLPSYFSGTLLRYAGSVLATAAAHPAASSAAYPNPTTGRVQLPAAGSHQQVALYDALGRRCCTVRLQASESTLDAGAFGAGSYHLCFEGGPAAPATQHLVVLP